MGHRRAIPAGAAAGGAGDDARADVGNPDAAREEAALWARLRASGDGEAREALAARYVPFAKAIGAKLFARRANDEVGFEDHQQLAMVGLLEAVDRYEPERGARFTTFALPRIRGAVLNGLERMTEQRQQWAHRRQLAGDRLASLVPERPVGRDGQELLEELEGIGVELAMGFLLESGGDEAALPRVEDAYAQLETRQLQAQLWEMVKLLPDRERELVSRHYRGGTRFDEMAAELHLTKGRISQLHRQAIERLRALFSKAERCDVSY